jgi:hypothetical protein
MFRFQCNKIHLTYKGWLELDQMTLWVNREGFDDFQYWSLVHEEGDVDEEGATPYKHTHFAAIWAKKQRKQGARLFDVGDIHPNVQTNKGLSWMEGIMTKYHLGHKTKKDGKKYYIEPIRLEQKLPPDWNGDIWDSIVGAPSLKAAAEIIDVRPKSLADIKLIRTEVHKRKFAEVEYDCDKPWVEPPSEWDPRKKSLVINGPTSIGKTNWAKNYFQGRGFEITELEDLKCVPEGTEGLIFDDQEYALFKTQTQKMVADCRKGCSIKCRHSNPWKPHLPAIFTTNNKDTLFDLSDDAICARIHIWEVEKMF